MKNITFILAMLFCPNLFAATLTANTVPYVCQGGASPQLCNSKMTTDSNGNILSGVGLGNIQSGYSNGTTYQATTDGFFYGAIYMQAGDSGNQSSGAYIYTSTASPASSSPNAVQQVYLYIASGSTGRSVGTFFVPVAKGEYFEISLYGPDSSSIQYAYFRAIS